MATTGLHLEVARIQSEINRLFEHLLRLRDGDGDGAPSFSPSVDVAESEDELLVELEVPGVEASSLSLFTEDGNLVVRGTRPAMTNSPVEGGEVILDERPSGPFERAVPLGTAVNPHEAEATLSGGVLTVRFPRIKNRRGGPVAIEVHANDDETNSGDRA